MTQRWTQFEIARIVEKVRFPGGKDASVQLGDRFRPVTLLLLSLCEARRPAILGSCT